MNQNDSYHDLHYICISGRETSQVLKSDYHRFKHSIVSPAAMSVLATLADYVTAQTVFLLLFPCAIYFLAQYNYGKSDEFPLINKFHSDWGHKKAKAAFIQDAGGLVRDGFLKVNSN